MCKTNPTRGNTGISYPYLVLAQEEVTKVIKMQMVLQYTENKRGIIFQSRLSAELLSDWKAAPAIQLKASAAADVAKCMSA